MPMIIKQLGSTLLLLLVLCSCTSKDNDPKTVVVDFSSQNNDKASNNQTDPKKTLIVAVAAVISPKETLKYYEELLSYISNKLDYSIEFNQKKTYLEVNELVARKEVDLAFICSGAYIEGKLKHDFELLAVPVCNGKPFYQAYVIVRTESGIKSFEQLKNRSFVYTDPLSNTGKLYADKRVSELNYSPKSFFKSTIYSYAHDISIQFVSKGVVDGATVDGLIFDYTKKFYPDKVKNIEVIEKSEYYGIPPVVVPSSTDPELKKRLKSTLLTIHKDSVGRLILDKLLIDSFIEGMDENYNSIRTVKENISKHQR